MSQTPMNIVLIKAGSEFIGLFFFTYGIAAANADIFAQNVMMGTVILLTLQHSGAMYNPVVTLTLLLRKMIDLRECLVLLAAQTAAVFCASVFAKVFLSQLLEPSFDADDAAEYVQVFFNEMVFTFILLFFINIQITPETAFTQEKLCIGLIFMFVLHTVRSASVDSGSVLNPAIGISLPIVAKMFNSNYDYVMDMWVWICAPVCGGLLAWLFFTYLYLPQALRMKKGDQNSSNNE